MPETSTLTPDYQRDWPEYFDAVAGKPPRDTLLRALDLFDAEPAPDDRPPDRLAIDLACGEGRDARAILARSPRWSVVGTDAHPDAIARCLAQRDPADAPRARFVRVSMEDTPGHPDLPTRADLINASFALPFCKPDAFDALWAWIVRTIRVAGRFSGTFFGERDQWACVRPKSHRTCAQTRSLFEHGGVFHVEHFDEVEKDGDDATGRTKHHHVFHVVARKIREGHAT